MTARQKQVAGAQADIERWENDLALALKKGDAALIVKIRGWIADRKRFMTN